MEELEPRLLFSADLPGVLAQSGLLGSETHPTPPAITALVDTPSVGVAIGHSEQTPPAAGFSLSQTKGSATPGRELVFVDAGAPNYQQLINDLLKAQAEGRPIEVVVLETGRDGVEQITEALEARRDVGALHIVSHGSDGSLTLGSGKLNAYNLDKYRDAIASWQGSLTEDADLLIYGCDFAASAQGREMVETLSALTGADVAASNDQTGTENLGGDWELEYTAGDIDAQTAFSSELQESWQGTLVDYTVINTNDSGAGSLRDAINLSNTSVGVFDNIYFAIGSGQQTISLTSGGLPTLSDAVNIDATTQPGYVDKPIIELDGSGAGAGARGFEITADGNTIRGFVINRFATDGFYITSANNTIAGNFIGTDISGTTTAGFGNGQNGIEISGGGGGNVVGGLTVGDRNVISGNTESGVELDTSNNNTVLGNFIGTDLTGTIDLGNTLNGVVVWDTADGNIIGGTVAAARNIISGNEVHGIFITNAPNTTVLGNYIGTDVSGMVSLGNTDSAVSIEGTSAGAMIGGTLGGARNVIAADAGGTTASGVRINASNVTVQGNYIGVNAAATASLRIDNDAIKVMNEVNVLIGGSVLGAANVIGGALDDGIEISGGDGITVQGNFIGTDPTRTSNLASGDNAIEIDTNAINVSIGGAGFGEGNVIANSNDRGVSVKDAGSIVTIRGNSFDSTNNLEIDIGLTGVTGNDLDDVDSGANALQNFPVLSLITTNSTETTIQGLLNSTADSTFVLDFYARTLSGTVNYLGFSTVKTDATGNVTFVAVVPIAVTSGQFVMATATNAAGGTSEFCGFIPVGGATGNSNPTAVDDAYAVATNTTLSVDWWDTDWTTRQKLRTVA